MQSKKLVLASNNKGKLREFQAMFDALGLTIVGQGSLGVSACRNPSIRLLKIASESASCVARNRSSGHGG